MKHSLLILLFFLMSACGTGSVQNCNNVDWQQVGQIDQELGSDLQAKEKNHTDHCEQSFDAVAWKDGVSKGLAFHCSPNGAFWARKMGRRISRACDSTKLADAIVDGNQYREYADEAETLKTSAEQAHKDEEKRAKDDNPIQVIGKLLGTPESERLTAMEMKRRKQMEELEAKYRKPLYEAYP